MRNEVETSCKNKLNTYGKNKAPNIEKVQAGILSILGRKVNGELPFVRVIELRRRVCNKVTAPSFFDLLKQMQASELIMISGVDHTCAECALWDHPRMIEWRVELAEWEKQMEEIDRRHAEEQREWDIKNAPRLAAERLQRELGEYVVDNSDEVFAALWRLLHSFRRRKEPWVNSRDVLQVTARNRCRT